MSANTLVAEKASNALTFLISGIHIVLLLLVTARPIVTDDLWWSLALGSENRRMGPWLLEDPLLFTAAAAPDPSAWLYQALVFTIGETWGFVGLRAFHLVAVLLVLTAVWRLFHGSTTSHPIAAIGVQLFIVLAAYRLCQLRAHLVTMLLVVVIVDALLRSNDRRWAWMCTAGGATMIWANMHAGFVLAPYLVALVILAEILLSASDRRPMVTALAPSLPRRLVLLALVGAAGALNPRGLEAYMRLLRPGDSTPALSIVSDEWVAFAPFSLPTGALPPSAMSWICTWVLIAGLITICVSIGRERRKTDGPRSPDATRLSRSTVSTLTIAVGLMPLLAVGVRFLWLAIFAGLPIALWASELGSRWSRRWSSIRVGAIARPAVAGSLLLGFLVIGDWSLIAPGTPLNLTDYQKPFSARKYYGHASWFLSDSEVEGNVFADYFLSGFVGFWSQGRLKTFINGSLNVDPETANDYVSLSRSFPNGLTVREKEIFDRYEVDIVLGIGMPIARDPRRPWRYTTTQLEGDEDWMVIFRSARSAVYLRRNEKNRPNLERVAAYFRAAGVPFEPSSGFDTARVIDQAPDWAFTHGLIPRDYPRLVTTSNFGRDRARGGSVPRLALIYASLGLYDRAAEIESQIIAENPADEIALRRRLWSLLRSSPEVTVRLAIEQLARLPGLAALSGIILDAGRASLEASGGSHARARVQSIPLVSMGERRELARGYAPPIARPWVAARRSPSKPEHRVLSRPEHRHRESSRSTALCRQVPVWSP